MSKFTKHAENLKYFEGNTESELMVDYEKQKSEGVFSGACSTEMFKDDMSFEKWLDKQVIQSRVSQYHNI